MKKNQRNLLIIGIPLIVILSIFISTIPFSLVPGPNGGDLPDVIYYDTLPSAPVLQSIFPDIDPDYTIELRWSASTDVWYYNIYRRASNNIEVTIRGIIDTSFIDGAYKDNGMYTYRIEAVNNIGDVQSNEKSVIINFLDTDPTPPIPPIPPKLKAIIPDIDPDGSVFIDWNVVTDATKYQVYMSKDGGQWELIVTTVATTFSKGFLTDGSYGFKVRAYNLAGYSEYSNIVYVVVAIPLPPPPPPPPDPVVPDAPILKGIIPKPSLDGKISLKWDKVSDAYNYTVYRSNDGTSYAYLGVVIVNYYNDLLSNGVYYYKLKAGNVKGEYSGFSNAESVTVQIPSVPNSPVINEITYEVIDSGVEIIVSWSAVSCDTYNLYREIVSDIQNTGFVLIEEGLISTSYSETLTDAGKYTYKVSAVNDIGESKLSNPTVINLTEDGVTDEPEADDYTWLYIILIVLGVAVVPVVILTRKRKGRK